MTTINFDIVVRWYEVAMRWATTEVLVPSTVAQIVACLLLVAAAYLGRNAARRLAERSLSVGGLDQRSQRISGTIIGLSFPIFAIALLWIGTGIANGLDLPSRFLEMVASLFTAWAVIRFVSGIAGDTALTRFVALVAWAIAALNIIGLLDVTVEALDAASFTLGTLRVSALTLIKGIFALGFLLWLAIALSHALERRIQSISDLTPSVQVLLTNLSRIVLIIVAIVAAISSVGIDLTAFAVFTGALGVGIGFGLQKVFGNFISGIIILLDKSIKPGDVIEIGETYGRVVSLGARYVSVTTPDAHEHLIPNEDLITQRVVNWSFSDQLLRQIANIGIHYKSDPRQAIEQCLEAAAEIPRILDDPKPACWVRGFGDSSVDLMVSYWINDPMNGLHSVRSELLLNIWDRFHAHGIEIPYPQRDIHIKDGGIPIASPSVPDTGTQ